MVSRVLLNILIMSMLPLIDQIILIVLEDEHVREDLFFQSFIFFFLFEEHLQILRMIIISCEDE